MQLKRATIMVLAALLLTAGAAARMQLHPNSGPAVPAGRASGTSVSPIPVPLMFAPPASGENAPAKPGVLQQAAQVAPPDVQFLLRIEDAAMLRRELSDRPIAQWIASMIVTSEFHRAWAQFALHARQDAGDLFDACFGRRVTVMSRRLADENVDGEAARREWAVVTDMPAPDSTDLLMRLQPRTLRSRAGFAVYELPEHDLLLARRGGLMLIGPRGASGLLFDVLNLHTPGGEDAPRLAQTEDLAVANELGSGNIALFLQHDRPLGGHSAIVAQLSGDDIGLRHRARFESPPFARGVTTIEIDVSPLRRLEDHALVAVIEPADIGISPIEAFVVSTLGEGLLNANLRARQGQRRVIVLGEIEGRQEEKPVDVLAPTIAIGIELTDADGARDELDMQMISLARRLDERGEGRFEITLPDPHSFDDGAPRQIDISAAATWFTGAWPIAEPLTLNWSVVNEMHSRFAVIASHPDELRETILSLSQSKENPAGDDEHNIERGRFQSCGVANGVRIARTLESWAERPDLFFTENDDGVPDPAATEFRQTLRLLAQLAAGIDRARWRLARPSTHEMSLDVEITLTAPESTRPE